jgi:hypothetical protein
MATLTGSTWYCELCQLEVWVANMAKTSLTSVGEFRRLVRC